MDKLLCEEWRSILDISLIPNIDESKRIIPEKENIWKAFNLCKPEDVKVVIIGQDPYHTINKDGTCIADGLAFSYEGDVKFSLKNIFTEIERDIGIINFNSKLDNWAKQGILLLNTSLTTYENEAGAHTREWKPFMEDLIKILASMSCIFVLWGTHARKYRTFLFENTIFLEGGSPSAMNRSIPFIGCGHFSQINFFLRSQGEKEIDWRT